MNKRTSKKRVTLGEFVRMSSKQRAIAFEESAALLRAYEQAGQKPPMNEVYDHYELADAFG